MNKWSKFKKVLSLFTFARYQKIVSGSNHSSFFIRMYRWWDEQLTVSGKPVFTIWLLICLPATFQIGKPAFYICLVLGSFNFFNYLIAYFLVHLKVNVIRNHSLATHAGQSLSGYIELSNIGMTKLKDIEVFERELPVGISQPIIPFVSDINKNTTTKIPFTLQAEVRGEYNLKSIVVATSYPFGLIRKIKIKKLPQGIIVYPQILPVQLPKYKMGVSTISNQQTKTYDLEQNEYIGNREYSYGDQFTAIDHKAWGRMGYPVTKIYQNDFDVSMSVIFIPTYKNIFEEDHFENAIKITASIVHQLVLQKTKTAFFTLTEDGTKIIPEIFDPEKVYETLSVTKNINIKEETLLNSIQDFSQQFNYFYIIGTEIVTSYLERLAKILPEGVNANIIICSDQNNELPHLPKNFNCFRLAENDLKKEAIPLG